LTCRKKVKIEVTEGMTFEEFKLLCVCDHCCGNLKSKHYDHIEEIFNKIAQAGFIQVVHDKNGEITSIASSKFKGQD
jgi:hypothetical protein